MHKQVRVAPPATPGVGRAGFPALLIDRGFISRADLARAQRYADREHVELADAFVTLTLISETDCYSTLAEAAGLDLVNASDMATSELAIRLVPERIARRHAVVPLSVDNRTLTYATCQPFDPEIDRDLSFASGRRLTATVAPRSGVMKALERCYPKLHELDVLAARLSGERSVVEGPVLPASSPAIASTVVDLCDHMIARAVEVGASDLHVECGTDGTTVRYRICGVLEPVLSLPASVSSSILNRFKIMARADISIHHRPQDGAFQIKINGRPIDIRLSTLPIVRGEKIVMRVIDSYSPLQSLDRLLYDEATLARFRESLARPDGLILVTGPTGSGKTTALYAALAQLRTGRTNIVSVEDPVERRLDGVTQIPVNPRAGNTFPIVLRSLMRQDPNVIMVGEIRDEEVAQIVGQAAYTGHLVLSSMHTVDAATAITRLANLGLEPYKIAESLCAVLAQRLLRTLCPSCKRMHADPDISDALAGDAASSQASAGSGCQHCNHTGYLGRIPVAELLTPSDELRAAISRGATAHEIRAAMRAAGYPTMRDRALQLVAAGITSIEEVNRVLTDDTTARNAARDRPRILVVDDDTITRMLVKLLLERERFDVLEAANGHDAVEIAVRERPDLMIIDLNMPGTDGYEAIGNLRKDLSLATLPILVLTSEEGPGIEHRVLQLGADDYMLKPFDPDVLLSRVNAVFRRQKVAA
jgi:type IV pilus assembly protein PilB